MVHAFADPTIDVVEQERRNAAVMPLEGAGMALFGLREHGFAVYCPPDVSQSVDDQTTSTALAILEFELAQRPLIVTAYPGPLLGELWNTPGVHGRMVTAPDQALPWHAVVLTGVERRPRGFWYLDPFFPAAGVGDQPFFITREKFAFAWLGEWAAWPATGV